VTEKVDGVSLTGIGVTVGTQVIVDNGASVGRGVTVGTILMVGTTVIVGAGLGLSGAVAGDAQADKASKRVNNSIKMGDFLRFIFISFLKIYNLIFIKIL
jgi:hypothetical protein